MKSSPRTMRLILSLVLGIAFSGLMLFSDARAVDLEEISKRGKIVVATEAAFAPFEFIEDGEIVGYDKDILDLIIAQWGVELEQLDVPFAGILVGLDQGKYDLVSSAMMITPENVTKYAYTSPVAVVKTAIMKKTGNDRLTNVEDLSGLVLGAVVPPATDTLVFETHNNELVAKGKSAEKLLYFQSNGDLFVALTNDQIDGAVNARTAIADFMKTKPGKFEVVGEIGEPLYVAWAVRGENIELRDEINGELRKIRDSGKMSELQMKWFGYTMDIPDSGYMPPGAL